MRHRYLVCYDVSDAKRLRAVFKKMCGYGDPVQYSVFLCDLSLKEKYLLLDQLGSLIHHQQDRVMIVNTGPAEGRGSEAVEFLGRDIPPQGREAAFIV
ncbi:MAG: CRISPR-associated endonuclease Cas2 [Planctomycetota bacterium]